MAKAVRKTSRNTTKLKLVTNRERLEDAQKNLDAQLEYEQNKKRFLNFKPRNENQRLYLSHIETSRLVFATGPSGVGKSLCATLWACEKLEAGEIDKIVVTRPMVGCDEDMGFLPGTEEEKYIGWVGPVLELLEARLGKKRVKSFIEIGKIVLKPLMMMRGSTFRDSVVILDEAQNTTIGQMKMFLTRIGEGSKVIVNGDLEQNDLPNHVTSGLEDAVDLFRQSKIVKMVEFTEADIVRDPLVREIVRAYRKKAA